MKPLHLALVTVVGMYAATTMVGAALFTTEFGRNQLEEFMGFEPIPFRWMTTLGSPLYWTLLLSLAVILPVAALAAERIAGRLFAAREPIDIPTWIPIAISAVLVAWGVYKLSAAGALGLHELLDRSLSFSSKMERRVDLIRMLGNRYYAFAYSSLPILASFLLAKAVLRRNRLALAAFLILSLIVFWFDLAILMKGPIIIYVGLIALTLILSGFGWIRSLALTAPLVIFIFAGLSQLQFSNQELDSWTTETDAQRRTAAAERAFAEKSEPGSSSKPDDKSGPGISYDAAIKAASDHAAKRRSDDATRAFAEKPKPGSSSKPDDKPGPGISYDAAINAASDHAAKPPSDDATGQAKLWVFGNRVLYFLRNAAFRMASAFPYYVQAFFEPDERCGLELPAIGLLPHRRCFAPTKVFHLMYPKISYTTGFAPAPANVAAYAELGLPYSFIATAICGANIGVLAFFARGRDPFSVSIGVATAIYAYYVSQVSLVGSLLDSYGLIWLLLPVAAMALINRFSAWLAQRLVDARRQTIGSGRR